MVSPIFIKFMGKQDARGHEARARRVFLSGP
jgi:hypothetical protein